MSHDYDTTRNSWNVATRNHNAHKGDQAAFFRAGKETLFPEELELVTAHSWQHGVGDVVTAIGEAGLRIELLREYPYANGCKVHPTLELGEGRRYHWPDDRARLPLMYAVVATRP
jgi:hypothetical protein